MDLAVLDLGLPDGNGLDLVAHLRERGWPRLVVLSAADDPYSVRAAFVASADDAPAPPADGPVRQLLVALMTRATDKLSTPTGRSIMRMMVADDVAPELTETV